MRSGFGALGSAVEVHDEAMQHALPPELEAEHAAVLQQRPRVSLGGRRRVAPAPGRGQTCGRMGHVGAAP